MEVVRECKKSICKSQVRILRDAARRLKELGCTFQIKLVPGHQGAPGNEKVNEMVRALLHAEAPLPVLSVLIDEEETDLVDQNETRRLERRSRLQDILSPDQDMMSTTCSRWDRTCIRMLATNTGITPVRVANYNNDTTLESCDDCEYKVTQEYLFWQCPSTSRLRKEAF